MANNHNIVVEIDATRENWKICVRVVRLWCFLAFLFHALFFMHCADECL